MKKKQLITFVSLLLCFLTFSGFFFNKTKKYIDQGDKALLTNDFQRAYENYRKAGEEGKESLKIAYLREIRYYQTPSSYRYTDKRTLEDVLNDIEKTEQDKDLYGEVLLVIIREMREEKEKNREIYPLMDRLPAKYQSQTAELRKQMELEDFEENLHLAISSSRWDRVLELCRENSTHEQAEKILDLWQKFDPKPTVEAAEALKKVFSHEKVKNFWNYMTEDYVPRTLDDSIQFRMAEKAIQAYYLTVPQEEKGLTEIFDSNRRVVWLGIDRRENSLTLTDSMVEELKKNCGQKADGKILFLHDRAVYNSSQRELDLVWDLMKDLPEEYQPASIKQVKYLVYLKSDYTKGGTYNGGTQQIHETTKLSLYDTETGRVLYSKTVRGKSSNVMTYYGSRPAYYSHESPDMCRALAQAMKKINDLK